MPELPESAEESARKKQKMFIAAIYVAIAVIGAILLLPDYWYLWLIILAICVWRIVFLLSPRPRYNCMKCGTTFQEKRKKINLKPSASDLYTEKGLKCPKCGSEDIAKVGKSGK